MTNIIQWLMSQPISVALSIHLIDISSLSFSASLSNSTTSTPSIDRSASTASGTQNQRSNEKTSSVSSRVSSLFGLPAGWGVNKWVFICCCIWAWMLFMALSEFGMTMLHNKCVNLLWLLWSSSPDTSRATFEDERHEHDTMPHSRWVCILLAEVFVNLASAV